MSKVLKLSNVESLKVERRPIDNRRRDDRRRDDRLKKFELIRAIRGKKSPN